jgi:magnesium transporter
LPRFIKRVSKKKGLMPGSLVYVGDKAGTEPRISVIDYDEQRLTTADHITVENALEYLDKKTITWIDLCGVHDVDLVRRLGEAYELHSLVQEDILNTGQRPKFEESDDYLFLVLKMLHPDREDDRIEVEQVSFVIGPNYVISFQEKEGDVFDPVRERLRKTVPRVRFLGADYLAYALIDAVVDGYFLILETMGEKIEQVEERLLDEPKPEDLEQVHELKRELLIMRKAVWPLREVIGAISRSESKLIHAYTFPYLRDLYEHTIQVIDTIETFRDMVSGLLDLYLTSVSNRMNEIMKVLTIIATIFIPLGFLAGVYGMNFDTGSSPFNMPELHYRFGYPIFWLVALLIGGGLFLFFRKRRWL